MPHDAAEIGVGRPRLVSRIMWPLGCLCLLILLAASLLRDIREPFIGLHDFNTADHAQFARVLLRQPASVHHFLATYALGMERPAQPHHYAHHPPMITWLTALSFMIFGDSEWSARLAPILCSLAGLALFLCVVRELCDEPTALLAGLLYAVTPVGAFFGRMANHEAPTLCFILLAVWGWNGLRGGAPRTAARHVAYFVGIACAIYSGWPGTIAAGVIAIDALILRAFFNPKSAIQNPKSPRLPMAILIETTLWPALILAVLVCHLVFGGLDGHWNVWWDLLTTRTAGQAPPKQGDDPMRSFLEYTVQNFTWPALLLAALFLITHAAFSLRRDPSSKSQRVGVIWLLVAVGAGHLCFYRQALIHHYWWFYCWPPVAYFAARGLRTVHSLLARFSVAFARSAVLGCLGVIVVWGYVNTSLYFSYVTYPPEKVAFWTDPDLARIVPLRAPIQLAERMTNSERYRSHTHWWWGEPATAYYMDRPFVLTTRAADLAKNAEFSRFLIVSDQWLARWPDLAAGLNTLRPLYARWGYRVYDVGATRATSSRR